MPTVTPLRSGDPRRLGRYRLTGRIEGFSDADGNPDAFLGRGPQGTEVAVTLPGRRRATDAATDAAAAAAARERFIAGAGAARRVDPFCVARILDTGLDDGGPYLVSEHVPGPSLREVAEDEGPLTGTALIALAIGMATGLAAIHEAGLAHGSFGPDHVIISPAGPRVVHFGIIPPRSHAAPAADLLAWALTVVYAAVGRPMVGPQDLTALPEPLRGMVAACLAPQAAGRPTARAVLTALLGAADPAGGLLAEGTRQASQVTRGAADGARKLRPARRVRRPSQAAGLVLACVACLAVIAAGGWFIALGGSGTPAARSSGRPSLTAQTIPAAIAGTWSGLVRQTHPVLAVEVRISLAQGSSAGTISYPALGCSGTLRVAGGQSRTVRLRQRITAGRGNCDDGTVILTAHPSGQLAFTFRHGAGPSPAGELARVKS
jgi:hypothetical protein